MHKQVPFSKPVAAWGSGAGLFLYAGRDSKTSKQVRLRCVRETVSTNGVSGGCLGRSHFPVADEFVLGQNVDVVEDFRWDFQLAETRTVCAIVSLHAL